MKAKTISNHAITLVSNDSVYVEMTCKSANCFEVYWHDWLANGWRQEFPTRQQAIKFINEDILEGVQQEWIV